jgi:hypothetical protein
VITDLNTNFVPAEPQELNIPDGHNDLMERDLPANFETIQHVGNLEDMAALDQAEIELRNNLEAARAIALENVERLENNTDTETEDSDIMDRDPVLDSSIPLTLSLSSHFLLTNGPEPSCLALWDVIQGTFVGFLDDAHASRINRERLGPLRFAEVSVDSSMIYSVSGDLVVWNFRDLKHSEAKGVHRYFVEGKLDRGDNVWIGYETHEKM